MAGLERRQKILFAVLGLLVLVFLFRMFMSGGGGGGETDQERAERRDLVTTTVPFALDPSEDVGEDDTAPPEEAGGNPFDGLAGRNPFEPVVSGSGVPNAKG
jgi:hypothetical protein